MLIDLSHFELITLIKGTNPSHNMMDKLTNLQLGSYDGSRDCWNWRYMADYSGFTEHDLYAVYQEIKNTK